MTDHRLSAVHRLIAADHEAGIDVYCFDAFDDTPPPPPADADQLDDAPPRRHPRIFS